mgnify:CR=1 FL=1|jgi:hypothetical protein|tara:strand:- start:523 stop:741 length:219 start_codon:yes stop_codon:yes gene_type:complete
MNPILTKLIGGVLNGFTKKNLNPKETPSTGIAYAGVGAIGYLAQNPPGTEYDVLIQLALAVISAFCFYAKKN